MEAECRSVTSKRNATNAPAGRSLRLRCWLSAFDYLKFKVMTRECLRAYVKAARSELSSEASNSDQIEKTLTEMLMLTSLHFTLHSTSSVQTRTHNEHLSEDDPLASS